MNEVISKLYEIEEKAEEILRNARQNKDNMRTQMEYDQQMLEQKMKNETDLQLTNFRNKMDDQAMLEISVLKMQYDQRMKELNERMEHHLDEMASELFKKIIEV